MEPPGALAPVLTHSAPTRSVIELTEATDDEELFSALLPDQKRLFFSLSNAPQEATLSTQTT
jgi:hypothetical protein